MRPVRKRLLFATALLLVVLLGLGGWFYFAFYRSTYAAIQHAEAFNFRRLQVAEPDEPGTYRFFYATNRRTGPDQASLETQFANEREAALKFGFFDTAIEPTLGVGMIIAPTEWFQNEVIRLRRVEALDESTFVVRLHKRVQDSPQRSLLVVVHGFREAYPSALRKTAFLGHVLDINSPVLLFDWPGDQGSSLTGYRRARRVAEESGAELARTLELVIREVQPERLWLVANSMGGQVVADAFALLHQHADLAAAEAEIEHVVLTAPDVGRDDFGRQFEAALTALA
jgi:esterase/lipase superfamily enzyme